MGRLEPCFVQPEEWALWDRLLWLYNVMRYQFNTLSADEHYSALAHWGICEIDFPKDNTGP